MIENTAALLFLQSLTNILPIILYSIFTVMMIIGSYLFGHHFTNRIWKNNVVRFLPDVAKEEIADRDMRIIELENIVDRQKEEILIVERQFKIIKKALGDDV